MLACFAVEGLDWGSRVSPRFHQTGIGRATCPISVSSVSGAFDYLYNLESLNLRMVRLEQPAKDASGALSAMHHQVRGGA